MDTGRRGIGILGAALLVLFLGSCQKETPEDRSESRVDRALRLMDRGEHDEAILILEKEAAGERVHQLLASAYAARAGVRVQDYWGFVVGYRSLLKEEKPLTLPGLDLKILPEGTAREARELLERINSSLAEFARVRQRAEQIPYVKREARPDLHRAVQVLTGLQSRGARLYRAILELILIRSAVDDMGVVIRAWEKKSFDFCSEPFAITVEWMVYSSSLLIEALEDLSVAYPSQAPQLQSWREDLLAGDELVKGLPDLVRKERKRLCGRP